MSAMQNIQNLLQVPCGCGEQNMVLLSPNMYVLNYLNETQQLTPEIKSKALGYLISGYQRQLNYKHQDSSYSTFGEQYGRNQGNTCGKVEDEVALSAYITIAFLKIPLPDTGTHGSHSSTKTLLAYAFALVGNQDKKREILKSLDEEAVKEDNSVHWEWECPQKPRAPVEHFYQPWAPSAEVEMMSYVLLAYLMAQPALTSEELTSASRIMKWITKQQNSQEGFSFT
ncbi:Pregnancy zone protein [Vulpes lagopus]